MTPGLSAVIEIAGPVDLPASIEPFRRWGDDLIDRWDGTVLRRCIPRGASGGTAGYAAWPLGDIEHPGLRVEVAAAGDLPAAIDAASAIVVDAPSALSELRQRDALIDVLEQRRPGVRQMRYPDLLEALIRAISAQQVNLRWAATTRARLAQAFGTRHEVAGGSVWSLEAERLAGADVADVRALQFTTRKAEYIVGCADEIASGRLALADLAGLPDAVAVARLVAVRGIGRWTAEWVLARTLGRALIVAGDLAVRKVVAAGYLGLEITDETSVRHATRHWGEAATVAQWILIHAASEGEDLSALRTALAGAVT